MTHDKKKYVYQDIYICQVFIFKFFFNFLGVFLFKKKKYISFYI